VAWAASRSSVRGSRTIAAGNPPESFGAGRNRSLQTGSKQAEVHVLGIGRSFCEQLVYFSGERI